MFDEEAAERGVSFCHTWGGLAGILREKGLLTEVQEGEVRAQCRAYAAFEPTEECKVFDSEWDPPAVPEAKKKEDMTDGEKADDEDYGCYSKLSSRGELNHTVNRDSDRSF